MVKDGTGFREEVNVRRGGFWRERFDDISGPIEQDGVGILLFETPGDKRSERGWDRADLGDADIINVRAVAVFQCGQPRFERGGAFIVGDGDEGHGLARK